MASKISPYANVKDNLSAMAGALMRFTDGKVWIHEKQLYNIIGTPNGPDFAKRSSLKFLFRVIEKDYWGNKRGDHVKCTHGALVDFTKRGIISMI